MFLGDGRGGAEQARLRTGDELDGDARHHVLEPALGDEALVEAGTDQFVLDAQAEPAGDHHRLGAMRQREIARGRTETTTASNSRRWRTSPTAA